MKPRRLWIGLLGLLTVALLAGAGWGLHAWGLQRGQAGAAVGPTPEISGSGAVAAATLPLSIAQGEEATRRHLRSGLKAGELDPVIGRRILYYHDPMVPGNKFDQPARSPFMDMMLVPVYAAGADADGADSRVAVSPRMQQSLGLRTAPVTLGRLAPQISAVGNIAWNEREQSVLQARAGGFVERLHVRATLDRVSAGQPLIDLYVPDWLAVQEEYLALRRMHGADLTELIDAARQRLRQAGMGEAQIAALQDSARSQPRITLTAPRSGVISELLVRDGMSLMPGATLLRIQGTDSVWAQAEVPESQAGALAAGSAVQASSPALPGLIFSGKIEALLPEVNAVTRTRRARLVLHNPQGQLVPGMFVQMQFTGLRQRQVLLIPSEALIQTGPRTLVMLADDSGHFKPVEVEIGSDSGSATEIRRGLSAGQRVVVSAQFLIDSEASLKGLEARLNAGATTRDAPLPVKPGMPAQAGSRP